MIYSIEKIRRDVHLALQRPPEAPPVEGCQCYSLSFDELIDSKIAEAVRAAHLEAEPYQLEAGHNLDPAQCSEAGCIQWTAHGDGSYSGRMELPQDFLRLVVFQMDDWRLPAYVALDSRDTLYSLQRSGYAGLRGSPQRPLCFIGMTPQGKVLEFFSCGSPEARIKMAVYVPEPVIDQYGGIDISQQCYQQVIAKIIETLDLRR